MYINHTSTGPRSLICCLRSSKLLYFISLCSSSLTSNNSRTTFLTFITSAGFSLADICKMLSNLIVLDGFISSEYDKTASETINCMFMFA